MRWRAAPIATTAALLATTIAHAQPSTVPPMPPIAIAPLSDVAATPSACDLPIYFEQSFHEAISTQAPTAGHPGAVIETSAGYVLRDCDPIRDHGVQLRLGAVLQLAVGNKYSPPFADDDAPAALGFEVRADWPMWTGTHWRVGPSAAIYDRLGHDGPQPEFALGVHATYEPITFDVEVMRTGAVDNAYANEPASTAVAAGLRFGSRRPAFAVAAEVGLVLIGIVALTIAIAHSDG